MKYRKRPITPRASPAVADAPLLGMLYIVDVRLVTAITNEKLKHRLLVVGCEQADIERKLRWMFDAARYKEMSISGVEKVREKVHFLSTVVSQPPAPVGPVIERGEGTQVVHQVSSAGPEELGLYAVGITTTMFAHDAEHALRKVGSALVLRATEGSSKSGASLSEDSTVVVEEIPRANGYARARDVSIEKNRAHLVRG